MHKNGYDLQELGQKNVREIKMHQQIFCMAHKNSAFQNENSTHRKINCRINKQKGKKKISSLFC